MGKTKQLVPWPTTAGPKPLIAVAYDAIRPICNEMIVVLGHEADAVAAALGDRLFHRTFADPDVPMFDSILAGLRAARSIDADATLVLQPGDHPEVAASTLTLLMDCSLQRSVVAIIPEYEGRGGHPVLIPPSIAARLSHSECPRGLGQFWLDHPELCHRVPVNDCSVLRDVDTPSDLNG
jgi:molybdenum cofactor cytidylyltransferase